MTTRPLPFAFALLLTSLLVGGCFGRTTVGASNDKNTGPCIDLEASSYDQSCERDSDCMLIVAGQLCAGYGCDCGESAAINTSSSAAYEADFASVPPGPPSGCECGFPGVPQCVSGVCRLCSGSSDPTCDSVDLDAGPDASADSSVGPDASPDSSVCVDIVPASFDQSCLVGADCVAVLSGELCTGYTCACPGGGAINVSAKSSYDALISSVEPAADESCGCPAVPGPQCIGGICTMCSGFPSDPPGCQSTAPGTDGSTCMDVDLSTYDQSCQTSGDCIAVTAGVLCPGACLCGGAAVNASEELRYDNTVQQLGTSGGCPCVAEGSVACIQNQCVVCGFGPNQPAGCGALDAGW